jgi:pimeloyl-ACP methyl ester carboxylesterase
MDLPIDLDDSGPERCAAVVAEALAGVDDLVLVGHSLAGSFLPLAAERTDAALMVFLCAMVPIEGLSLADQQAENPDMVRYPYRSVTDKLGRTLATRDVAQAMYYSDCTDAQIDWAMPQLRPQAPALRLAPFPVGGWPDIPSAYVLCTEDPVVSPDWSRRVARERLGVTPVELPGGHSPFLSRPAELAETLAKIVVQERVAQ